jgi:hypothetical protein
LIASSAVILPKNVKLIRRPDNNREKYLLIARHCNNRKIKNQKKIKKIFFLWELKNQSKAGFLPPPFNSIFENH